jgi:recombination protein RecA
MQRANKKVIPSLSSQVKRHSLSKSKEEEQPNNFKLSDLVPMGSTLLNLAMSGTIHGGAQKGKFINIIGESHGGKTVLALTSFAEANKKESFDDYAFVYDDVERANAFDMPYMFGKETAERIQPARPDKDDQHSETIQHFQANILHWLNKKKPFIYILDSFDALDALEDQKKVDEMVKGIEKNKEVAGTYGMAKAKGASAILRGITSKLANTQAALFIISQTRDNVDPMSFQKETRSGGRALKFYSTHELWLKHVGDIKKNEVIIGNRVKVKVSKSKLTGKVREASFDVYYDYGIDDIGSCIDYLIKMERWSGGGSAKIDFGTDFSFSSCTKSKLINMLESPGYYQKLQKLVEIEWNQFEDNLKLNRKRKYQ